MEREKPMPSIEPEITAAEADDVLDGWLKGTFGKTEREIREGGRKSRAAAENDEREYGKEEASRQN